jgi:GT2 family glycosyltransferase
MNRGLDLVESPFVLLLNQDVLLRPDYVERALAVISDAPDVGMVAGRIYKLADGRKTSQLLSGALLLRRRIQLVGDPEVSTVHDTFSPTWCCPFLRMAMLNDVRRSSGHYFDSRYFAYGEDLDLAIRAQLRGWKCVFSPDVVAWHTHSGSLGGRVRIWEKPAVFRKHALRNRYMTIAKDLSAPMLIYLLPFLLLAEVAIWPYFLVQSPGTLLCLLEAAKEAVRFMPETLCMRENIERSRLVSPTHLKQFLKGL